MILKSLKRRSNQIFLKNNYDSFIKNSQKQAPAQLNSVLLITDHTENSEQILSYLRADLDISASNITHLVFSENKVKNDPEHILCEKDFGWYGKVDEGFLKKVLTNKYDLLINQSKIENLYTDLLVLQVKADLKVGFGLEQSANYDLLIQVQNSETALFTSELKKYLEILK